MYLTEVLKDVKDVKQATQGAQAKQATQAKQVMQVTQVTQGRQATQAKQVMQVTQGRQATQVTQVTQGRQATQAKQVMQVTQGRQATQVTQGRQVTQGTQAAPPVSSTLTLRNANPQDQAFVDALTRSVMTEYVSQTWFLPQEREAYFRKNAFDLQTTKIIHLEKKDVGRLSISETEDFTLIDNVQLLPEFQGLGIGYALIKALIERSHDRKAYVKLQVLRVNPARRLYERLGFYIYAQDADRFYMRTASEG